MYSTIGITIAIKNMPNEFPKNLIHLSTSKGLLTNKILTLFCANSSINPSKESQTIQGYFFIVITNPFHCVSMRQRL